MAGTVVIWGVPRNGDLNCGSRLTDTLFRPGGLGVQASCFQCDVLSWDYHPRSQAQVLAAPPSGEIQA